MFDDARADRPVVEAPGVVPWPRSNASATRPPSGVTANSTTIAAATSDASRQRLRTTALWRTPSSTSATTMPIHAPRVCDSNSADGRAQRTERPDDSPRARAARDRTRRRPTTARAAPRSRRRTRAARTDRRRGAPRTSRRSATSRRVRTRTTRRGSRPRWPRPAARSAGRAPIVSACPQRNISGKRQPREPAHPPVGRADPRVQRIRARRSRPGTATPISAAPDQPHRDPGNPAERSPNPEESFEESPTRVGGATCRPRRPSAPGSPSTAAAPTAPTRSGSTATTVPTNNAPSTNASATDRRAAPHSPSVSSPPRCPAPVHPATAPKVPTSCAQDAVVKLGGTVGVLTAHRVVRIVQVAVVAQRVRTPPVAREPGQILGQLARNLGRAREVLVLLLPQPRQRVAHVDAAARAPPIGSRHRRDTASRDRTAPNPSASRPEPSGRPSAAAGPPTR